MVVTAVGVCAVGRRTADRHRQGEGGSSVTGDDSSTDLKLQTIHQQYMWIIQTHSFNLQILIRQEFFTARKVVRKCLKEYNIFAIFYCCRVARYLSVIKVPASLVLFRTFSSS